MRKYRKDVWNLRLTTPYLKFRFFSDFHGSKMLAKLKINYKFFFLFFFKLFKSRRLRFKRKSRPFLYRIDIIERRVFLKRWKYRFVSLRLIKVYYIFLKERSFRKMARLAKRTSGLFQSNFILLLEGRLLHFIYRSGFVDTLFKSFYIIKSGFVSINSKVITFFNSLVKVYDIVSFSPFIMPFIYCDYIMRMYYFMLLHPPMRSMFVSYIFMFFFFFKNPVKRDIPKPLYIDMYRLCGYPVGLK